MSIKTRWVILAAGLAAGAFKFVLQPDAASPAGAALFLGEVLILLALALRYAALVEGRPEVRTAAFLALLIVLVWAAEAVSMKTGFLGGGYSYGAAVLNPGIGGVPLLVLLCWALFGLLSGSVTRVLLGREPAVPLLLRGSGPVTPGEQAPPSLCGSGPGAPGGPGSPRRFPSLGLAALVNGAVMLGIDLAVEWHFSGAAGFWAWRPATEGSPLIDGIPPGNFLLWFAVGCAVPVLERLAGAALDRGPRGAAKPEFLLRVSPALGFALLLAAGTFLDLEAAAPIGALACGAGFFAVAARLFRLKRTDRRENVRASG